MKDNELKKAMEQLKLQDIIVGRYIADVERTIPKILTKDENINCICLGLAGEVGEVLDYIKKVRFHGHTLDNKILSEEIGDLLWYVFALMSQYNLDLKQVLEQNMEKRAKRYPNGFNSTDSISRIDKNS